MHIFIPNFLSSGSNSGLIWMACNLLLDNPILIFLNVRGCRHNGYIPCEERVLSVFRYVPRFPSVCEHHLPTGRGQQLKHWLFICATSIMVILGHICPWFDCLDDYSFMCLHDSLLVIAVTLIYNPSNIPEMTWSRINL